MSHVASLFVLVAAIVVPVCAAPSATTWCLLDAKTANCKLAKILALIPIRSGSKSVPDKNIRMIGGKPLVAHSIAHALASRWAPRVLVSTDSSRYQAVARAHGAEAPFLRPDALAGDYIGDLPVVEHALSWLAEHEHYVPDIVVHLRATCPVRSVADLDAAVAALLRAGKAGGTAVRSVVQVATPGPWRMWTDGAVGPRDDAAAIAAFPGRTRAAGSVLSTMEPLASLPGYGVGEAGNSPRQLLPPAFVQDSCIDVAWRSTILAGSMTGSRVLGYVAEQGVDIDTESDFQAAQCRLLGSAEVEAGAETEGCDEPAHGEACGAGSTGSSEGGAAAASDSGDDAPTIFFGKFLRREGEVVWEDEQAQALAFRGATPPPHTHVLVIPKLRTSITRLSRAGPEHEQLLGHLMVVAARVAEQEGLGDGWRLVINDGPVGAQSVHHLHLHVTGGIDIRQGISFPPEPTGTSAGV